MQVYRTFVCSKAHGERLEARQQPLMSAAEASNLAEASNFSEASNLAEAGGETATGVARGVELRAAAKAKAG